MIQIARLFFYPIKSCRGIEVEEFEVSTSGPQYDRQWMIIDGTGKCVTQRQIPKMGLIETQMNGDRVAFKTPLMAGFIQSKTTDHRIPVSIWGADAEGLVCDDKSNEMLADFLGKKVLLVEATPEKRRLNPKYGKGAINFPDSQPILMISEESLAELSKRMGREIEMERFRPNIVIRGVRQPHEEDNWEKYSVGSIVLKKTRLCSRCVMVSLDPKTGVADPSVLKMLARYRTIEGSGIAFGTQGVPMNAASIQIGDLLKV